MSLSAAMDHQLKRALYEKHRVRNYWLIDPQERWIRAYVLGADGRYELSTEAHGDASFVAQPFPDQTIQLAEIWDDLRYA